MKLSANVIVDTRDTSQSIVTPATLQVVLQTNGVVRIHGSNGGYLFSLQRDAETGKVYSYVDGFGVTKQNVAEVVIA